MARFAELGFFVRGVVFLLSFGQRTPRGFSTGSFLSLGSGASLLFLSLPLLLLFLLLFWGPARVLFFSSPCVLAGLGRRTTPGPALHVLLVFLPLLFSLCPGRPSSSLSLSLSLSLSSVSLLSLSLSLSFFSLLLLQSPYVSDNNRYGMPLLAVWAARLLH